MKKHVEQLHRIAHKNTRKIIGLMSGTSLDGLDIALCAIEGNGMSTRFSLEHFTTVSYDENFRHKVLEVFSKKISDLEKVCLLNKGIANSHAYMILQTLKEWKISPDEIDLIASHGQTIYHAPQHLHGDKVGHATLQVGDGDQLAVATGIITISDFRQKHIAGGGEGAPLAAYGDLILFTEKDTDVVLLNIGGIANFTYLPCATSAGKMFSTDCGPGNTMMDAWMREHFPGENFDKDAAVALRGRIHEELLTALHGDPFFKLPYPKSTGPELFSLAYLQKAMQQSGSQNLSPVDVMATLNRFSASVICEGLQRLQRGGEDINVYVSGGGMHNPLIMSYLKANLSGFNMRSTAEKNVNPDAKEAILFALLANECVAGEPDTFKNYFPNISMGKISFPG